MVVVRFIDGAPGDFEELHRYLIAVHVRALAEGDGFVTLSLMQRPRSLLHELQELQGYINTWNMIHPYQRLEIVQSG